MGKVADPVRRLVGERINDQEYVVEYVLVEAQTLIDIADEIDRDHAARVAQSRNHVWHSAMRDIRYCANQLERKRRRREVAEDAKRKGA